MENKTYIWLIVGISLIVLTSAAPAQDEQWLQYHSERKAQRIIGDMGTSTLQVLSSKPQGVELPQFKAQQQFFAQWSTPMVKSGQLWIALDSTQKQGRREYRLQTRGILQASGIYRPIRGITLLRLMMERISSHTKMVS